ncbi:aspartate kinase [Clostridium tagluense]|nr:aspartate kinase [Clostridium tagluense]MCB2313403.1 aspartate kinase [Clostridium tagluense]MCB2318243.1 aspartate kinase [Clostridium tagluense]MCB2323045.1 aspartate kinase [Clostridium tagluense]MCB2328011.1 aspartate kinase [Clostridium tagluense]MCB2332730.1 aspartate kinase [Clostridium tagluense]
MMEVIVAKFGGSSLCDSEQFKKVKDIVLSDNRRAYVVPSAPGKRNSGDYKITDLLYLCHEHVEKSLPFDELFKLIEGRYTILCSELNLSIDILKYLRELKEKIINGASEEYVASRGEYFNGLILAEYLGYEFIDAAEIIVFKKSGRLDEKATYDAVNKRLSVVKKAVIPGFYGASRDGEIRTFSRGGSDITGAIIAKGVWALVYENWTDVSGFLMADPNIVSNPKHIEEVTYKELRELSYMGANVFHEEAIFPVKNNGIPINIRNTNNPLEKGTTILNDKLEVRVGKITGIAGKKDFTVIAIEKTLMNRHIGYLRRILSILENNNVAFEHIPSGIDSVSLVIDDAELDNKLDIILEEIENQCKPDSLIAYPNMALIAVVGEGMIKTKGISSRLFSALSKNDINIRMINQGSSELSIFVGVENEDFENAIRAVYKAFEN